jgi:hypothetical protein
MRRRDLFKNLLGLIGVVSLKVPQVRKLSSADTVFNVKSDSTIIECLHSKESERLILKYLRENPKIVSRLLY